MKKVLYYLSLLVIYVIIATIFEVIVSLIFGGPVPILQFIIVVVSFYLTYTLSGRVKEWMGVD